MTTETHAFAAESASTRDGLIVHGLTIVTTRRRTPVVKDVSFRIEPGRVLALVGESGSGKSTVGVALLGLARRGLSVDSGSVAIAGQDVLAMSERALRAARGKLIAYVPQDPTSGLNPSLTVGRQLREAIAIHPDALLPGQTVEDRVRKLMKEVGLPDSTAFLRSYPHQMSGGQQQRVGIAMAFSCRPRVIVLDEPTTGLDVTTQRRVLETVRELTDEHQVTSIYVSHDLAVVSQIADQTAVMYAGRLVEHAPTQALFAAARHPYSVGLLRAVPSSKRSEVLVGIDGRPPRPGRWPSGCAFASRCRNVTERCREELPELRAIDASTSGESSLVQAHEVRCFHPEPPRPASVLNERLPLMSLSPRNALTVSGLYASYGSVDVLHDVNLEVGLGRCTAVVGESGSGKTTFARSLVGLHTRWTGDVSLDGASLANLPRRRTLEQRRSLQYVFQNPFSSLNPRMSVRANLEEPLRYFTGMSPAERREKVMEVLDVVALSGEYAERMPQQLSGGERQRVAIGRALTIDPEVLVCDEVTSALDVSVQALVVEQLRQLQRERQLSMVFITHNLAVVRSIAQDVVVLAGGRIVESGTVDEVMNNPQHAYTRQLLHDVPSAESS